MIFDFEINWIGCIESDEIKMQINNNLSITSYISNYIWIN